LKLVIEMIERIKNFLSVRSRVYLVYAYDKKRKISTRYINIFKKLSKRYKLRIIEDASLLSGIDFTKSPIIKKNTIFHFKECLDNKGFVFLVFDGEKLVFRGCVQKSARARPYKSLILGKCYLNIPPNSHYIEYCETHPSYRGQRIFPWALYEICKKLASNNIYIATDLENISSQKGIEKCGFVIKEVIAVVSFLSFAKVLNKVNYFGESILDMRGKR